MQPHRASCGAPAKPPFNPSSSRFRAPRPNARHSRSPIAFTTCLSGHPRCRVARLRPRSFLGKETGGPLFTVPGFTGLEFLHGGYCSLGQVQSHDQADIATASVLEKFRNGADPLLLAQATMFPRGSQHHQHRIGHFEQSCFNGRVASGLIFRCYRLDIPARIHRPVNGTDARGPIPAFRGDGGVFGEAQT